MPSGPEPRTPRADRLAGIVRPVIWLLSRSTNVVLRLLRSNPDAGREEITGEEFVKVRDLLELPDRPLRELGRPAPTCPAETPLLATPGTLHDTGDSFVLVVDTVGAVAGIVTFTDVVAELVGGARDDAGAPSER
jgi:CBS domain containing-hemolysin-like protein